MNVDSKLEGLWKSLESLAEQHTAELETVATIETAAKALHFIQHIGRMNDFWEYSRRFNTEEAWPKPLHSFATRDEAMSWLQSQSALPYETVVEVAGTLHNVSRMNDQWVLIRFPSLSELEKPEA
jgi:hypothetical protein